MIQALPSVPALIVLLGLSLSLPLSLGCGSATESNAPPSTVVPEQGTGGTVTMEVDVDGNVQVIEMADVAAGTVLESLMRKMTDPQVMMRGSSTTAFVDSIGGKATSASEGWTFSVDGEFSNLGVGSTRLQPPTTIRWRYGDFESSAPQ